MRSSFDLLSLLLDLAAVFGYVNHRVLRLPLTVGLLLLALSGTILLIAADAGVPGLVLKAALRAVLAGVDLPSALLNCFLSFLLFAGALEVDFADLVAGTGTILTLATLGTVLSTALIAASLIGVAAGL